MTIVIRRSPIPTGAQDSEESLAERIDIGRVHAVLYRRGEIDLAAALLAARQPEDACALAQRLRSLARRAGGRRFFRDYRTLLRPEEAATLGLVALWYERVGRAGCQVWADLGTGLALSPGGADAPAASDQEGDEEGDEESGRAACGEAGAAAEPLRQMPDWLTAPESSIWSA